MTVRQTNTRDRLLAAFSLLLLALAVQPARANAAVPEPATVETTADAPLGSFELDVPASPGERAYLGLGGEGKFGLKTIDADIVLIEVFNFYCPHCQHAAPQVNELYRMIEGRSDLNGRIKMIGIGASNSVFEVKSFKEKYRVPFPLFPDEDLAIARLLDVHGTPTFIGVGRGKDGSRKRIYFHEGGFSDPQELLGELTRAYGPERGQK